MDEDDPLTRMLSARYVAQGRASLASREKILSRLVSNRRLLPEGLPDQAVTHLLTTLATMDSNNFLDNVGVGEREGRVFSSIVGRRCFGMTHGIGRSGDVTAEQPKACGSSAAHALCGALARDALRLAGMRFGS